MKNVTSNRIIRGKQRGGFVYRLLPSAFCHLLSDICLLTSAFCLLFSASCFAGAAVSVTGDTWAIGVKGTSDESTSASNNWTITNDNSGGTEDVLIKVESSGSWTASTDATLTNNEFLLRKDNVSGQIITAVDGTLATGLINNGTYSFGLYFKTPPIGSEEGAHTLTLTLTATNWIDCGNNIVVNHTSGTVAPVDKTVTYGTVATTLGGTGNKCWITQNLGADNQASSATDNTEPSAGWYWQFNRAQGFKHDGTTRTPSTAWISSINEDSDWISANDPCTLLLGTGWRLPTSTEWSNANANGLWANRNNTYASVLKIHAAGELSGGSLMFRGSGGSCRSSTQNGNTAAYYLYFYDSASLVNSANKAYGFSVRCLKD